MTTITAPGLYPDLDSADYLADPIPGGSLSSTLARLLTKHVPAKAIEQARRDKPSHAMNLGSAAHAHALGTGPQLIVFEHDGRTRDGKTERAAAAPLIESGAALVVTADEHVRILDMAEALQAHEQVYTILEKSTAEVSAFWRTDGVWMRARYDLLNDDGPWDYKTAADVTRRGFSKAMASYGYHQQADFYERGLEALKHPAAGAPMRFICQETEPPYLVQIHTPDDEARELARILNDRAIGIYQACKQRGEWPGFETLTAEPTALPSFYYYDFADALPDNWRGPVEIQIGS